MACHPKSSDKLTNRRSVGPLTCRSIHESRSPHRGTQPSAEHQASQVSELPLRVHTAHRRCERTSEAEKQHHAAKHHSLGAAGVTSGRSSQQHRYLTPQNPRRRLANEPPHGTLCGRSSSPASRQSSLALLFSTGLASSHQARESRRASSDRHVEVFLQISLSFSTGTPENCARQLLVNLTVARNRFLALAVRPYVMATAASQEAPAALGQSLLQVATLHGRSVHSNVCAHSFLVHRVTERVRA